jgi:hypothetical protein
MAFLPYLNPSAAGGGGLFRRLTAPGDERIEHEASRILQELIESSTPEGYPFPPGTILVGVEVTGNQITVDLTLPEAYLNKKFDSYKSDAINKLVSDTLMPIGLSEFRIRASDRSGKFIPLSGFLDRIEVQLYTAEIDLDPVPPILGPEPGMEGGPAVGGANQPKGFLSGKTVWLSPGHGWMWNGYKWVTQRPNKFGIVEDFSNVEAINAYLVRYLWNAGADVWVVRDRSLNENEIIIDNEIGSSSYIETGVFTTSESSGYGGGSYRYAISDTSESATATWRPDIQEEGIYPVWVWYRHSANRSVDTRYRIHHAGGDTTVSISQEVHGSTWRYLGEFYFQTGTSGYVSLTNESSDPGQAVIADAIRFGGGRGASYEPRFEEASLYHAEYMGYPVSDSHNDVIIRPMYAEWEKSKGYPGEDGVFISWHTNCCDKSGTLSFIHSFDPTPGSAELQSSVHSELVRTLRAGWNPDWQDRGQLTADFGEVRELVTMPGVLLEVAYHDTESPGDADDLKEPRFRQVAARGVYQGIVNYFAARDGTESTYLPQPPTHLSARNTSSGQVTLSWHAPQGGSRLGDEAESYRVYTSQNGRGFDNGIQASGTSYTFNGLAPGKLLFFRVTAVNRGGESFPTSVIAVRTPNHGQGAPFLVVDGFDRLDAQAMISQYESSALGTSKRMFLERMNRFDYVVEHAGALDSCGFAFDSAQNEAVEIGDISLRNYRSLDWFTGEQAGQDPALSDAERNLLENYLDGGGNLILSGSEIGWDLARPGGGADQGFYSNYLKAGYLGDDAATYHFTGSPGNIFEGLSGGFDDSTQGYYDVQAPDRLAGVNGSSLALSYKGGTNDGAALVFTDGFGVVYFGFPLEAVTDSGVRNNLICKAVEHLLGTVDFEMYFPVINN